ncbi:phosphatase [Pelodictyon phaeoclathratiforme]|jgi:hypothetical protein|uniref:Putative phosphatase regulatory subunit n=1 Tax=Pelodictyon phaeoclathratiforme (strain DSM 5477 / BU-1) TaxID=324925 RepID=B4SFZ2_PELPB|nr:putative phosphatase regulatory subunit [Pelodictyon phaeoclathratiforme BU-1]MBV5290517.1 hypothetical protein [Pelodictyon phaeoclathratiforme]
MVNQTQRVFLYDAYMSANPAKFGYWTVKCNVIVKNLAFEKNVTIWPCRSNDSSYWHISPCLFIRSLESNFELWSGLAWTTGARSLQFAIRYDVSGATYWDNNDGGDYFLVEDKVDSIVNTHSPLCLPQDDLVFRKADWDRYQTW